MSNLSFIEDALAPLQNMTATKEHTAVATHCLYPSNAAVTVFISGGGKDGATVSDDGGAIDELSTHNRIVDRPDRFLARFCRPVGLEAKQGKIISPVVPFEQLPSAVVFVANASAAAARWGFEHIKYRRRRDLRKELHALLVGRFTEEMVFESRLQGKSSRSYRFDQIVRLGEDRKLIIDPVAPDPNSINAHAIAHMDVGQLEDERIIQRLVYDDEEEWKAADLNLLQMASTLVPFSRLTASLDRFSINGQG